MSEAERPATPCEQLQDHLLDLRMASASGTSQQLADHRRAMQRAFGSQLVTNCEQNLDAAQIACSIAATDLVAASACSAR